MCVCAQQQLHAVSSILRWIQLLPQQILLSIMARCERKGCNLEGPGVLLRANREMLCGSCNLDRLRAMSPTGLTRREEMIAADLFKYYRECGINHEDALEKLSFVLAMAPATFTRLAKWLDELRNNG